MLPNRNLTMVVLPDGTLATEWQTLPGRGSQAHSTLHSQLESQIREHPRTWLLDMGLSGVCDTASPSLDYFLGLARHFVHTLVQTPELEELRQEARIPLSPDLVWILLDNKPAMAGAEYIDAQLLQALWEGMNQGFSQAISRFEGSVAAFFHQRNPRLHPAGRVFFHLVENRGHDLPFAFMATYSAGMGGDGNPRHLPLKHALDAHDQSDLMALLSTVHRAAETSELVADLIEEGELFHPLAWDSDDALEFLREIPSYEAAGILCRIPDWWTPQSTKTRLQVTLGERPASKVGLGAIMDCDLSVALGGVTLGRKEILELLESTRGLALIKNKWVAVDPDRLNQALAAMDRLQETLGTGIPLGEAMRYSLTPDQLDPNGTDPVEIRINRGQWLAELTQKLKSPKTLPTPETGSGFKARLRPYQTQGMAWLTRLYQLGLGACLADDMGLGKTLQVLALLSSFPRETPPSLLVVPTPLIANWEEEILKFLPGLRYHIAHPGFVKNREKARASMPPDPDTTDLVITSYTLAKKYDWPRETEWNCIILDEAQAIKNPATAQTRAVKAIPSAHRIALTGTPVENRLSDLWSLFDFLNPGLLGNKAEFGRFTKSLKTDPEGYGRLRRVIAPYILRRLKTDKSVIPDLPDKVVMKIRADLTRPQALLYQRAVADLARHMETAEGIQRKGMVLAALMKFKQLCNHPDQLAGTGDYKESQSGKFQQLRRICETIREKRERVLIFTQFKEMTEVLRRFLEGIFHHPGLVLHGSVPAPKRREIVQTFQGHAHCPFMVLSLKAGGVGLNLTRANHVVHFDRWWNPAVENQATDRAFRIGQTRKVLVHTFVTRGTIEEKIDTMLTDKQEISESIIVPSGESLVTEMDNSQLLDLFRLEL